MGTVALASAVAIATLMVATWIVSLARRDASVVDVAWGLAFVVVAWTARWSAPDGVTIRQNLLVAMTTIWGLRLAGYLGWRNRGAGEDRRYARMRRRWGGRFWLTSLVVVFGLQGALVWVVSLPVQVGLAADSPDTLTQIAFLGVAIWTVGFAFETLGDWQLARFRRDPDNGDAVLDRGLWRWTRHPNYFGDCIVWWGIGLVALETGGLGVVALVGPLVMTVLLLRVSGVPLLERSLEQRRPAYRAYATRTSRFVPRPPRRS